MNPQNFLVQCFSSRDLRLWLRALGGSFLHDGIARQQLRAMPLL